LGAAAAALGAQAPESQVQHQRAGGVEQNVAEAAYASYSAW
jgi:hypothetical protein